MNKVLDRAYWVLLVLGLILMLGLLGYALVEPFLGWLSTF